MSIDNYLPVGLTGAEVADLLTFSCQHTGIMALMRRLYSFGKKRGEAARMLSSIFRKIDYAIPFKFWNC